jgi:O-antigen/teichoic acid export membrane protein
MSDPSQPAPSSREMERAEARGLVRNVSWSSFGTAARVLIAGGALAVISRLVTPADMGLYGIGWAGASFGYTVSMSGAAQAIIALPVMEREHIGAAQFLSLLIAAVTAGLLVLAAPFATGFYHSADVGRAVMIGALFVPFMCLGTVDVARAQKALLFSRLAMVQTAAVFLAALTAIVLALLGEGLIALFALQGLIGFYVFLLARLQWRSPGFHRFRPSHLRDIAVTGLHLSLGSLTGALWQNLPQLILGKVASVESVGLYVFCSRVVQLVFTQLSGMINTVIYPTFARHRDNPEKVGASFLQTVRLTYLVLNLPLLVLAAAPASFLKVYGGAQWSSGETILCYLAITQMTLALGANVFPTFAALGRPSVAWRWNLLIGLVQGAALLATSPYGINAMMQSLAVTAWVMPLAVSWLSRVARFRMRDYVHHMAPLVLALVPAIAVGRLIDVELSLPALVKLALGGGAAIAVYAGAAIIFDGNLRRSLMNLVRTRGLHRSAAPVTTECP